MRIAFHSNQLGLRGTDVALYDYALFNQLLLNNESVIISAKHADLDALPKFRGKFNVMLYEDFSDLERLADLHKIDAFYFMKAGFHDGKLVNSAKNLVHAVFQHAEPHGDVYAYISEWLSKKMTDGKAPFVPYMINLPETDDDLRKKLSIPADALVFGRHGGFDQFDIPFVHSIIEKTASTNPHVYFLFMNSRPFCNKLPNVIHLGPTYDLHEKVYFINTCDFMIHARIQGESFGLSIAEFLWRNKPVITFFGGCDLAHIDMLRNRGIYYRTPSDLEKTLTYCTRKTSCDYRALVQNFEASQVIKKFSEVFLTRHNCNV
jgi:hypothetical protein